MTTPRGACRLSLTRLQRPEPEMLQTLETYEWEAFGPTGLRTYDLAVMAEAGAVYVARVDDEIVGGCQLVRMFDEPDVCYLVGFYVRPAWQGDKMGRMFLEELTKECKTHGIAGIVLTVSPDNEPALALYRSAGFVEDGFAPRFYGEGEDRYVLRWRS